ncbi:MAG: ComEC/Rec2 family competence protein [Candidatus Marinimicrobia bacterium]|nr:ComEC/Rec2 family competence protein [Candidatus Neomarinimicrobiota bacterium]
MFKDKYFRYRKIYSLSSKLRNTPVLVFLVIFIIGIIIANFFSFNLLFLSSILFLFLMLTIIKPIRIRDFLFVIIIILAGMLRLTIANYGIVENRKITNIPDTVRIQITKMNTNPYYIKSYNCNVNVGNKLFKSVLYLKDSRNILAVGKEYEITNLKTELIKPQNNPLIFDYRRYMEVQGITHSCKTTKYSRINEKQIFNPLLYYSQKIRRNISTKITSIYGIKKGSLLNGFFLGLKKEIPDNLSDSFKNLGISHLLAVSGLHVGFIVLLFFQLFTILKISKKTRIILLLFLMLGYCYIIGFSASITRASLMTGFFLLAPLFYRKPNALNSVAIAGLIILLWNPLTFFDVGFQFSFSAVFGIIIIYTKLKKSIKFRPKNKFIEYVYNLILVSFCATLSTAPLSIYYFGVFNTLAIFINIFFIPLTFLILSATIFTIPFLYFSNFLSNIFIHGLDALITLFLNSLKFANKFSFWTIKLSEYKAFFIIGILVIIIFIVFKNGKFRNYTIVLFLVTSIFITIWNRQDELLILSLEKGRCVIIKSKNESVLINTGKYSYFGNDFEYTIKPILDELGIAKVNVILTKLDKYHSYNLENVLRNYEVENIYSPDSLNFIPVEKYKIIDGNEKMKIGKFVYDIQKSKYNSLDIELNLHNKNLIILENEREIQNENSMIILNNKFIKLTNISQNSKAIFVARDWKSKKINEYNLFDFRAKRYKLVGKYWISVF